MSEPVLSVFGWCSDGLAGTTPDRHHNLCKRRYRTQFGVEHECACPGHEGEDDT